MKVVADFETDGLLGTLTRVWCGVAQNIDTGERYEFTPRNLADIQSFAASVDHWIGHNFLSFDARVLRRILGIHIPVRNITDTLIKSRLQCYSREGGHSLENWGKIVHRPKPEHDEWDRYSPEMLERCRGDVTTNYEVYLYLLREGAKYGSAPAERLEHGVQHLLNEQQEYGFPITVGEAYRLQGEISSEYNKIEMELLDELPPISIKEKAREITPKYKKDGTLSKVGIQYLSDNWEDVGGPHSRLYWEDFDPGSVKQKVRRLEDHWDPVIRTVGYRKMLYRGFSAEEQKRRGRFMWRLCEENFGTIKSSAPPSMHKLGRFAMLKSRGDEIKGWFDGLGDDGKVHGYCQGLGAITHRMSHSKPNLGNTAGVHSPYGTEFRRCFHYGGDDDYVQLGTDASGIQLRILAHYMNDPDYTEEVVNGDIHTKNLLAMGIDKGVYDDDTGEWSGRATAKTFIYAWLLGAGNEKVGLITGGTPADGRRVKEQFLDNTPALAELKRRAAGAARSGRLVGLDGRYIEIKSEHFALSVYLQGGESTIMKKAMILYHKEAHREGLDFQQLAVVHDEFQSRVREDQAERLGQIQVDAIVRAGLHYNLNCPLDGAYKIGRNWLETH